MARVSIVKGETPDVPKALKLINFKPKRCDLAVIKPNLCAPLPYYSGATTDLRILTQTIEIFKKHAKEVLIVESDGYGAKAEETFEKTGMKGICDYYGVGFVNLNKDIAIPVRREYKVLRKNFRVPKTMLKADCLINLPVMKTHSLTTVTLSCKNMLGLLPGVKAAYHPLIRDAICDVMRIRNADLNIMDGIIGMEGSGPIDGEAKRMDLVLASRDSVALDVICCKVMRISPIRIDHIQKACYYGLGECNPNKIKVVGAKIEDVMSRFRSV